jgi:hypothetical protein
MRALRFPRPSLGGLVVLVAALTVLAPTARPVAAETPLHEAFTVQFANEVFADCGDFQILGSATVEFRITTFVDDTGTPVRAQVHIHYLGTVTNSVTGATLPDTGHLTETFDLDSGEERLSRLVGLNYQTTVPGLGTIVQDVGLLVFEPDGDVIPYGPHEFGEAGGYVIYCPYLA